MTARPVPPPTAAELLAGRTPPRSRNRLSVAVVGSWCAGLTLTPHELAGEYLLAATPVYLTSEDIVRLVAIRFGRVDDEFASWVEAWADEPSPGETKHDRIARYWDRLP